MAAPTPAPRLRSTPLSRLAAAAACALLAAGCLWASPAIAAGGGSAQGASVPAAEQTSQPGSSASKGSTAAQGSSVPEDPAAPSSASTVEQNKTLKFKDIPEDALITIDDLRDLLAQDEEPFLVVDIRSHRDYQKTLIEGTRNIPAGRQIEIRIDEFPTDETVVLIAYKNSDRLAETRQTLIDHGIDPENIKVVEGGVNAWKQAGYPVLKNQFLGC